MSVNRDMRTYILQVNKPKQSESGAQTNNWERERNIVAAVYKKDDMRVTASEKYTESTHTGLTFCKDIRAGVYRLVRDARIYEITESNPDGRLTVLLLKEVTGDGG